jgi:hypothetical protein
MRKVPTVVERWQRSHFLRLASNMTDIKLAKRTSYTAAEKVSILRQYDERSQYLGCTWFVNSYNANSTKPPLLLNTFKHWLKHRDEIFKQALGEHSTKQKQPNNKMAGDTVEHAMAEFITRSNAKRGTDDINWSDVRLRSLAAYLHGNLLAMTDEQRVQFRASHKIGEHCKLAPVVDHNFTSGFYKRHKDICVRNVPTSERAAAITRAIRRQPLYKNDRVEVRLVPEVGGYGLFTTRKFKVDTVITSYTGVFITIKDIEDALYDTSYVWSDKLFEINVDAHYALGSFGAYINDALDPNEHAANSPLNCSIVLRTVGGEFQELVVVADDNLAKGVQLCTSYGVKYWQDEVTAGALPPSLAWTVQWAYPQLVAPVFPLEHQSVFTHPRDRVRHHRETRPRVSKQG